MAPSSAAHPTPSLFCLTGNIGSGKTTVAKEFERLNIPVYYADAAAKRLMGSDPQLVRKLKERFGRATYQDDGELNRAHLAEVAFGDDRSLADLNALVHPAVHRDAAKWRTDHSLAPYLLYEAAITLEIGRRGDFAGIIIVHAPKEERLRRVMLRDSVTADQFTARAAKQWSDEKKLSAADLVIHNGGRQLLYPQVLSTHALLSQRSKAVD